MSVSFRSVLIFAATLLFCLCSYSVSVCYSESGTGRVVEVVNGATIRLESGETLRYIGVELPKQSDKDQTAAARDFNRRLVEGREVMFTYGIPRNDNDGAGLVYLVSGDAFVNAAMIAEGYARAKRLPGGAPYSGEFLRFEERAQKEKRGIWRGNSASGDQVARKALATPQTPSAAVVRYTSPSIANQPSGRTETGERVTYRSPSLQSPPTEKQVTETVPIEVIVSRAADKFIEKFILGETKDK